MRALAAFCTGSGLPVRPRRRISLSRICRCAYSTSSRKRIVFLGTPSVAATSLTTLINRAPSVNAEVVAVVTRAPAPFGRKREIHKTPVHETALQHGIADILTPSSARDDNFLERMEELAPDLCITLAYGNFLPKQFLATPKYGTLNIHPSLLPAFRGAAPVPRALQAGVEETGVTVAFTVLAMDAGPIVARRRVPLLGDERSPELLAHLTSLGTDALIDVLPAVWDGSVRSEPQNDLHVSHAPKISKEEARVTFVENARIVHNKVRAFSGWPGTWADFELGGYGSGADVRLKIIRSQVLRGEGGMCLGVHDVHFDEDKQCLAVTCDDGSVLGVHSVQPPGRKEMSARAFWNGLRGKRLGRKRVPH